MSRGAPENLVRLASRVGVAGARELVESALAAARAAVAGADPERDFPLPANAAAGELTIFGAFVSIHEPSGALRGCMGVLGGSYPARGAVERAAALAVAGDPRFAPMSEEELESCKSEVSLLTPLEVLSRDELPQSLRIGVDGLVFEDPPHRGLLLPQVASEHAMSAESFLDHTCLKAGSPRGAWRRRGQVSRFQALVLPASAPALHVEPLLDGSTNAS